MDRVLYVHDQNSHEFYFFPNTREGNVACEAKVIELAEKYGYATLYGTKIPPFPLEITGFDNFYGTVWLATLEEGGKFRFSIHSHWKHAKVKQGMGYKIKKIILEAFDESKDPRPHRPAKDVKAPIYEGDSDFSDVEFIDLEDEGGD